MHKAITTLRRRAAPAALVAVGCVVSAAAFGLPWDVDMADSQAKDGFTCWEHAKNDAGEEVCVNSMRTLPEGVVSQPSPLTPNSFTVDYDKMDERWAQLTNPLASNPGVLATGERMYAIYCAPCHGKVEGNSIPQLGTVSRAGLGGVIPLATRVPNVSDGHLYRVVRKGNAIMPAYGWAMTDAEVWSLVHYLRTLDGFAYTPPQPAEESEEASP